MKKYKNLEDFKKTLLMYLKQRYALKDDRSYFDVETSNIDGTFIGEREDNEVRIGIMIQYNPEYMSQINIEELEKQARIEYQKDLKKVLQDEE